MTTMQRIARLSGWIFVLIGIWGAAISGMSMNPDPGLAPRLWGLFPVNFVQNLAHLALGLWGLSAAGSPAAARTYATGAGALYALLALLGVFFPDGLGLAPLGGANTGLHALLGVVLLVAGVTLGPRSAPTLEPAGIRTVTPPGQGTDEPPHGGTRDPESDGNGKESVSQ